NNRPGHLDGGRNNRPSRLENRGNDRPDRLEVGDHDLPIGPHAPQEALDDPAANLGEHRGRRADAEPRLNGVDNPEEDVLQRPPQEAPASLDAVPQALDEINANVQQVRPKRLQDVEDSARQLLEEPLQVLPSQPEHGLDHVPRAQEHRLQVLPSPAPIAPDQRHDRGEDTRNDVDDAAECLRESVPDVLHEVQDVGADVAHDRAHHVDDARNDRLQRRQEPPDDIDRRANQVLDRVEEDADDDLAVLDVAADELHHAGPDLLRPFPDRPARLDQASNEIHEEPSDLPPEERQHGTEGTLDGVPRGGDAADDGDGSFAQLTEGAAEALLRPLPHVHDAGQEVLGEPVHEETDGNPHGLDGNVPRLADGTGDRLPDRDERLHQP